jgi:hypothetical protein
LRGTVTIDIIRHEPKKRGLNRNMMNQATPEGANDYFYHAFEELSIQNMDKIWSHNEGSSCVHPGWELVVGWIAIRLSWIQIFDDTESIKIRVNTLRSRKHGKVAIIICLEEIQALVNGKGLKFGVVATNIFEEAEAKWFLTHHHGSPLSNYFGPNSEIF